jgi:hypothetical protein
LPEAGVDDLHAGIAEGSGDDLGAAVVAVEAGLGDENADWRARRHGPEYTGWTGEVSCGNGSPCGEPFLVAPKDAGQLMVKVRALEADAPGLTAVSDALAAVVRSLAGIATVTWVASTMVVVR